MESGIASFLRRRQATLIFCIFVALSIVVVATQWDSYRHASSEKRYNEALTEGRMAATLAPLEDLIAQTAPANQGWRLKLAESYIELKEYDKALEVLNALAADAPGMDLMVPLMIAHYELGNVEEGKRLAGAVLAKRPQDPAANFYRGRDLMNEGKFVEAGQALRIVGVDAKWNPRAGEVRRELKERVFGPESAQNAQSAESVLN